MKRLEIKRDRVRENSPDSANRRIDEKMIGRLKEFAKKRKEDLMKRVDVLDKEWDIEQMLELNASILALAGTAMSFFFGKKWLAVPAVIAGFLIQHAIQGWCPPLPIFRWLGIRTQKEIQKERYEMMKLVGAK